MHFLNGLYLALLGWQMYTPTHSSPLKLASTTGAISFDLVPGSLPTLASTASVVALGAEAQSTLLPSLTPNITNLTLADFPPTDPFVIRLEGSPVSVEFYHRQYLKENRVQEVLQKAQVDIRQHDLTQPLYKNARYKYSAGKTDLMVPYQYQGELKWAQWSHGLDAVRSYMERFEWLGCQFNIYDHTLNRWYYEGRLMSDYGLNVTTTQNETVGAAVY